jgi:uncharacterized protein YdcH (DUF465 family)
MKRHLQRLYHEHRRLNRLIDTCRNAARQDEMKVLKRLRLRIKDKIAQMQRSASPMTR